MITLIAEISVLIAAKAAPRVVVSDVVVIAEKLSLL